MRRYVKEFRMMDEKGWGIYGKAIAISVGGCTGFYVRMSGMKQ